MNLYIKKMSKTIATTLKDRVETNMDLDIKRQQGTCYEKYDQCHA